MQPFNMPYTRKRKVTKVSGALHSIARPHRASDHTPSYSVRQVREQVVGSLSASDHSNHEHPIVIEKSASKDTSKQWIAVDLDNTLAEMKDWKGPLVIGKPIQKIVDHVKKLLKQGKTVKIFTARICPAGPVEVPIYKVRAAINLFCRKEFGKVLEITCEKDPNCIQIIDDKATNPKDIKAGGLGSGLLDQKKK